MDNSIRLVAEFGRHCLFAYDKPDKNGSKVGFIYDKIGRFRYEDNLIGSIVAHCPYWDDPETVFTPEDLERIAALPVYDPNK